MWVRFPERRATRAAPKAARKSAQRADTLFPTEPTELLSLTSLAGWEDAVLASITGAQGTLDERDRQIERSGVYGEYPAIVRAYEELFADAESAGEALKRAVFLVWRSVMEAPTLTGIAPLPDGTVRTVVQALDARVRHAMLDEEQRWMLAWYHTRSPHLFELYGATPALLRAAESRSAEEWRGAGITGATMALRGQMGRYWTAVATDAG